MAYKLIYMQTATLKHRSPPVSNFMSPREIKAKRILLGYRVKDLALEASRLFNRQVSEATVAQILSRRLPGDKPQVHELQKFIARKLQISVKDLKPPFETAKYATK